MSRSFPIAVVTRLSRPTAGAFHGVAAVALDVSRKQLATLRAHGAMERVLFDTYRLTASSPSHEQALHAALLWAGERAVGDVTAETLLRRHLLLTHVRDRNVGRWS